GCHLDVPIEECPRTYDQDRSSKIASYASGCRNFGPAFGLDASKNLAVDFNFACLNVGMHVGVLANDQHISSGNRTVEVTVNPERTGEFQLTGHVCSLVYESEYLIGCLANFHFQLHPWIICQVNRGWHGELTESVHYRRSAGLSTVY